MLCGERGLSLTVLAHLMAASVNVIDRREWMENRKI